MTERTSIEYLTVRDLTSVYNNIVGEGGMIKKFRTHADGVQRVEKALADHNMELSFKWATLDGGIKKQTWTLSGGKAAERVRKRKAAKKTKAAKPKTKPKTAKGDGKRGRPKIDYSGKILSTRRKTNPHRPTSNQYKGLQMIIDAGGSLPYDDYVKAGGEWRWISTNYYNKTITIRDA